MSTIYVKSNESIQNAISVSKSGDIVHLNEGTFVLGSGHIVMKSGIIIEGAGSDKTIIKASANTGGVSGSNTPDGWLFGEGLSNLEIRDIGFTSDAKGIVDGGHGDARNAIFLNNCKDVKIHDCKVFKYVYADFVKCRAGDNVHVYDCEGQCGHDFVQFLKSKNCTASVNVIIQTNTGVRLYESSNCKVVNSTFTAPLGSGWCAVELQNGQTNNVVDHCIVYGMHGSTGNGGVQFLNASGSVSVTDCVYWDVPGGFIRGGTPTVQSGNINGSANPSVQYWTERGYGYKSNSMSTESIGDETMAEISFTANVTSGIAPLKVMFTANVDGKSWLWDAGDGNTSKHAKTCTYTYKKPGIYDVSLTVDGVKVTKQDFITITDGTMPVKEDVPEPVVPKRVYVAVDGSGMFNCDGDEDQIEIEAAIVYADEHAIPEVYLLPGRYCISRPIRMGKAMLRFPDAGIAPVLREGQMPWIPFDFSTGNVPRYN